MALAHGGMASVSLGTRIPLVALPHGAGSGVPLSTVTGGSFPISRHTPTLSNRAVSCSAALRGKVVILKPELTMRPHGAAEQCLSCWDSREDLLDLQVTDLVNGIHTVTDTVWAPLFTLLPLPTCSGVRPSAPRLPTLE